MYPTLLLPNTTCRPLDNTFFMHRINFVPGVKASKDTMSCLLTLSDFFLLADNMMTDV